MAEVTQLFIRYAVTNQRKIFQHRKLGSAAVFEATIGTLPCLVPPLHAVTFASAAIDARLYIFRVYVIELA